ncbi:MAG TPA: tRNA (N6-isopentenyl adenosine(37)-C2)-methylthiotransferase MiaB [Thermodesulfobacteriota bacterium]|nr:tRNA (N6-isopentenyl adenosine(37)-C2)-methylthiotransferase MiaB [Thermodesulfobacteriota bacterium]
MAAKHFYLQTFGCQMNVYDSQRIVQLLTARNYQQIGDPAHADLILVNTCSVREKPEKKVYSALGRFRSLKEKNPALMIGVTGCMAQQEGERLLERVPFLDFVLGTKEFRRIPEILDAMEVSRYRESATDLRVGVDPYAGLPLFSSPGKAAAFVSIMQGCDNFCSYCIVPYVRGREVSRPSRDILDEIRSLSDQGVREVTLLGQNVNSYGNRSSEEIGFVELLEAVQKIPGIARIRFTTSHPKDLSWRLIQAFGQLSKLCEHIHLPLQSGSDRILKRMNRAYTCSEYREKISELRRVSPEISITTDIIVGFPGEDEADFQATLEMVKKIEFDEFFSFRYSDRPHTQASLFPDKVPEETKRGRLNELQTLQKDITLRKNKTWEGREVEVLVEGQSKARVEEKTGRTRTNRTVNFPGASLRVGELVKLRIEEALPHSLRGDLEEMGK